MKRIFIAIPLENKVKDKISGLAEKFFRGLPKKNMKIVPKENYHITLHFFGNTLEEDIELMKGKLRDLEYESFTIHLDSIGFFPSKEFIRVIWLGSSEDNKVKELHENLINLLDLKNKKFHTHLTLARVKYLSKEQREVVVKKANNFKFEPIEMKISKISIFESKLQKPAPQYIEVYSKELI